MDRCDRFSDFKSFSPFGFSIYCLHTISPSLINYEKNRPYGRIMHLARGDFTSLQKQQKPGDLDFFKTSGLVFVKKPHRLYQNLRGHM